MVRSFRYVATITAGQVITSLIGATLTLAAARETAQRQMAAEEKKKPGKVLRTVPACVTFPACQHISRWQLPFCACRPCIKAYVMQALQSPHWCQSAYMPDSEECTRKALP